VEVVSEVTGAVSLRCDRGRVQTILHTGAKPLCAMVLASEVSLGLGYWLSGPTREAPA
jgi:hypothetical protein